MALPGVSIQFSSGNNLGFPTGQPIDGVFAVVGTCSLGKPGSVYPIASSNSITSTLGYGPLAEACGQIFDNTSTFIYAMPGVPSVVTGDGITNGITDAVPGGLPLAPPVGSSVGYFGIPGQYFSNNGSVGWVQFASLAQGNVPCLTSAASSATVSITSTGNLNTAGCTITIGDYSTSDAPMNVPYINPDTGVGIVFGLPAGGEFQQGENFTINASPVDDYNVVVNILQAGTDNPVLWNYSLDNGNTFSGTYTNWIGWSGGAITGTNPPTITPNAVVDHHQLVPSPQSMPQIYPDPLAIF